MLTTIRNKINVLNKNFKTVLAFITINTRIVDSILKIVIIFWENPIVFIGFLTNHMILIN